MIKKNDFIEIEFTGKIKDGDIFDTNIKEQAEKANLDLKEFKPFVLAVGSDMVIKGLDECLEGKEIGKQYSEKFSPEKAFGKRDPKLIRMIPMKFFLQQNINPQRGMMVSLDSMIAKIVSVSGGRVLVDLNNPLAGKDVVYDFKINRKIEDLNEKINALQDYFFRKRFEFTQEDKTIIFKVPKQMEKFIELFKKQFKDILDIDIKSEIIEEKKEEPKNKEEKQEKKEDNKK